MLSSCSLSQITQIRLNKILVSFSFTFALELQLGVLYDLQQSSKLTDLLFFSLCMYCISCHLHSNLLAIYAINHEAGDC